MTPDLAIGPLPRDTVSPRMAQLYLQAAPITLHDIVLYDARGKPWREYKTVTLAAQVLKDSTGKYIKKDQREWITHYGRDDRRERLPSLPVLYAIMERMHDERHPGIELLAQELRSPETEWICTSTYVDGGDHTITHDYDSLVLHDSRKMPTLCYEPLHMNRCHVNYYSQEERRTFVQPLLLCRDIEKAIEVVMAFDAGMHLGVGTGKFITCGNDQYMSRGCSRWVTLE